MNNDSTSEIILTGDSFIDQTKEKEQQSTLELDISKISEVEKVENNLEISNIRLAIEQYQIQSNRKKDLIQDEESKQKKIKTQLKRHLIDLKNQLAESIYYTIQMMKSPQQKKNFLERIREMF